MATGMTVKHRDKDGLEKIEPVDSVSYDADNYVLIGHRAGQEDLRWTDGHAFVMNAAGKTVGVYNMRKGGGR